MTSAELGSAGGAGRRRARRAAWTRRSSTAATPSRHCARTPLKEKAWDQHIILLMTTPGISFQKLERSDYSITGSVFISD